MLSRLIRGRATCAQVLVGLSALGLAACTESLTGRAPQVACPASIEAPALHPGDTWAFRYNDGRRWRQTYDAVTEEGLLRGQGAYPRATFYFDQAHTLRKVYLDGTWLTAETPEFPEIGKPALEFPLTVGKRWMSIWYQYAFDQVAQDSRVAGCETITVPAGTFLAVRIEVSRRNTRSASAAFDPYTLWYAPAVKYWVKGRGGSSTLGDPFREFELVDFTINTDKPAMP
jgi:hypothetical protein